MWGQSGFDITHFLSWSTVYELPAGKGKKWFQSGPASWILGDWQVNYILQARSGQPYNLGVTGDIANVTGTPVGGSIANSYGRPNLVGDPFTAGPVAANPTCNAPAVIGTTSNWFNKCAFTVPSGSFGSLGRNVYRAPGVFNADLSLHRKVSLPKEGMSLQFRIEAFNVFNVQNWDAPDGATFGTGRLGKGTTINQGTAGQIVGLAQGTNPREIQFGLRFIF